MHKADGEDCGACTRGRGYTDRSRTRARVLMPADNRIIVVAFHYRCNASFELHLPYSSLACLSPFPPPPRSSLNKLLLRLRQEREMLLGLSRTWTNCWNDYCRGRDECWRKSGKFFWRNKNSSKFRYCDVKPMQNIIV